MDPLKSNLQKNLLNLQGMHKPLHGERWGGRREQFLCYLCECVCICGPFDWKFKLNCKKLESQRMEALCEQDNEAS